MGVSPSASLTSLTSLCALRTWSLLNLDSKITQNWLLWSFKYQKYFEMNYMGMRPDQNPKLCLKACNNKKQKKILYTEFLLTPYWFLNYRLKFTIFKILYQNIKQGFHFKSTANSHFSDFITFLFAALQKEKKMQHFVVSLFRPRL